MYQKTGG